jgi:hypothetical protein
MLIMPSSRTAKGPNNGQPLSQPVIAYDQIHRAECGRKDLASPNQTVSHVVGWGRTVQALRSRRHFSVETLRHNSRTTSDPTREMITRHEIWQTVGVLLLRDTMFEIMAARLSDASTGAHQLLSALHRDPAQFCPSNVRLQDVQTCSGN